MEEMKTNEIMVEKLTSIESLMRAMSNASMNVAQAAEYLNVSERIVWSFVNQGRLSAIDMSTRPGGAKRGRITFTREELDRFRAANAIALDMC